MEGPLKKIKWEWSLTHCARLVLCKIMGFLPVESVLQMGQTCKRMLNVSKTESLWNDLVKRDFGELKRLIGDRWWRSVYEEEYISRNFQKLGGTISPTRIFLCLRFSYHWDKIDGALLNLFKSALRRNVNPNVGDELPLAFAARNNYPELVALLLSDIRTNPSANNNQALRRAAYNNNLEIVETLLDDPRCKIPKTNANAIMKDALFPHSNDILRAVFKKIKPDDLDPPLRKRIEFLLRVGQK